MSGRASAAEAPRFSLVVPVYDEEDNVDALVDELAEVLPPLGAFEVLAVDDGSTDLTRARLCARAAALPWLRVLSLAENRGQSAALCAGFDHARAPVLAMMDGDLQNDPRDFARLLDALERADLVSGIRAERRDSFVRRASSRIANAVRNRVSGDRVVDSASGIKVLRAELYARIPRFNGMHRFLPTLARIAGARVVELPVRHRARAAGRAKYGIGNRALRAFVDLLGVRWLKKRSAAYELRAGNGLVGGGS